MSIPACTFRAVAAKEMDARGHTVIARLVRQIAALASLTKTSRKELLADGDSAWVVAIVAGGTMRTVTCTVCQHVARKLTGVPGTIGCVNGLRAVRCGAVA